MQTNFLLESWDNPELPLVPRSRLYNPPLIGQGTHLCEALLCYAVRLANSHSVSPLVLFNREIIPLTNIKLGRARSSFTSKCSKTINSYTKYAQEVSSALIKLTCRGDILDGTFINWVDVFDPKGAGMLHEHPRWCQDCLHDWRINGKTAYFPLLWYASPVTCCVEHKSALVETCSGCGKRQPFIPKHYHIDHCSFCGRWLGHKAESDLKESKIVPTKFELFAAEAIADMIREGKNALSYASYQILRVRLKVYAEILAKGSHREFERLVGFKEGVLTQWINKDTRPKIQQLLLFCFRLKTSPVKLLKDEIPSTIPIIDRPFPEHASRVRITLTAKQRKRLLTDLQEIIDTTSEPITLKDTCKKLGYTNNFLKYWFPTECRKISDNRKEYVSSRSKEKMIKAENTAYKVVSELLAEHHHLDSRITEKHLATYKLSQADRAVREGVKRAKREYFSANMYTTNRNENESN